MEIFYNEHGTIDRYEYYIFIGKYFIVYTEYKNKCNKYTIKKANLNGFEYRSARDQSGGVNIALFNASSLASRKPIDEKSCLCQVSRKEVIFSIERKITRFGISLFLVNGSLPIPAD